MTNKEFAEKDTNFRIACYNFFHKYNVFDHLMVITKRQASKFRNKKGRVYKSLKTQDFLSKHKKCCVF